MSLHISSKAKAAGMKKSHVERMQKEIDRRLAEANSAKQILTALKRNHQHVEDREGAMSEADDDLVMNRQDAKDMTAVLRAVASGNFLRADSLLDAMDTEPREECWIRIGAVLKRGIRKFHPRAYENRFIS